MAHYRVLGSLTAALLATAGCHQSGAPATVSRDSAGVSIVELGAPALEEAPAWVLSEAPDVVIGRADGDTAHLLYRVSDAGTLPDGGIAILSGQSIRIFDRVGMFTKSIGRAGNGPGEFERPTALVVVHDSIVVFDEAIQRVSVFSATGELVRTVQLSPLLKNPRLGGVFTDGSLLILDDQYRRPQGTETIETRYLRYGAGGALEDTLPQQPLAVMSLIESTGVITTHTFASFTATAGSYFGYWVATGGPEVRHFDRAGELQAIARWDPGDLTIRRSAVSEHIEAVLANAKPEHHAALRRELEETPIADRYPATYRAVVALEGDLWVERYYPYSYRGPIEWLVFSSGGTLIGKVTVPAQTEVYEVSRSHILGKRTDGDGVERIVRYSIRGTNG